MNVFAIGMSGHASDGGLERYYFDLLRALPQAGSRPHGLVVGAADGSCDGGPAVASFARAGDPVWRRWVAMRRTAPAYVRAADVVVSHFAPNAFPILPRVRERPFVVHFHGPWALEGAVHGGTRLKTRLRTMIERRVYAAAARFVVLSRAFAGILAREYRVSPDRIRIVRGGVDLGRFRVPADRRASRERLGWPLDRPIVTTVRRLVASKGVEDLIDAAAIARRAVPDLLVKILGTGPLRDQLARRIAESGLGDCVQLAGYVPDDEMLIAAYRASNLTIVPSIAFEGFGLVVIESLACGTPALVTNVGGLPETIGALAPQLVLERGPQSLARGIAGALGGCIPLPSEAACIAHARSFDWNAVAHDVNAVYREAM
jgi:glycosyltransferase involved in cell wall biosynthesis